MSMLNAVGQSYINCNTAPPSTLKMKTESRIVSTILPLPNIQVDEQDNYYFTDTDINASHRYQNHKNPILRFIDQITIPLSAFSLFSSVSPLQ